MPKPITLLILTANPEAAGRLRLDQEIRDIRRALERTRYRDWIHLEVRSAVSPAEVRHALLDLRPELVHFAGHGAWEQGLVFEKEAGDPHLVETEALARFFELFVEHLRCVVLNACYSEVQAEAVSLHIDSVVGMSDAIEDQAASAYAVSFYQALGAGEDVEKAHRLACSAIELENLDDRAVPRLHQRPGSVGFRIIPASDADVVESDADSAREIPSFNLRVLGLWLGGLITGGATYAQAMKPINVELVGGLGAALALSASPLALVFLLNTLPEWWERRREKKLRELGLNGQIRSPGYFRLKPYDLRDQEAFHRADLAHERIHDWLEHARAPLLYLTGRSGTGKSSLMDASVIPRLQDAGWACLRVRSFGDPVAQLLEALDESGFLPPDAVLSGAGSPKVGSPTGSPKAGSPTGSPKAGVESLLRAAVSYLAPRPLLVVVDQFEEFVILHQAAARQGMEELLKTVAERSIPDLKILLVLRSDYLMLLGDLDLPAIHLGGNWQEVGAFAENHARDFLRGSGLRPGDELLDAVLAEAVDLEETRGLIRPITLNLLGLILGRLQGGPSRNIRSGRLIENYLRAEIFQPELRDTAPQLLRPMITAAGTKQPRSVDELVRLTGFGWGRVRGCLLRLAGPGLVRCLDEQRDIWEISHDFAARRIDPLIVDRQAAVWRRIRQGLAPAALVLWLITATVWWPWAREVGAIQELSRQGVTVKDLPDGSGLAVDFYDAPSGATRFKAVDLAAARTSLAHLAPRIVSMDLDLTTVEDLAPLSGLTSLRTLTLYRTGVEDLRPLANLSSIRVLNLRHTWVSDLGPLENLSELEQLDLAATPVSDLRPLTALSRLEALDLDSCPVSDLRSLADLRQLRILQLAGTEVSDLSPLSALNRLEDLTLQGTQVKRLDVLSSLLELRYLNLNGLPVMDFQGLEKLLKIEGLDLGDTAVKDLRILEKLVQLRFLDLERTRVETLDPLSSLVLLERLDLQGTAVSQLEPLTSLLHLQDLNLQDLSPQDTDVVDLTPLANLSNLKTLDLANTSINDLGPLENLHGLQRLSLDPNQRDRLRISDQLLPKVKVFAEASLESRSLN